VYLTTKSVKVRSSIQPNATGFFESIGFGAGSRVAFPILQIIRNLSSPNPLPLFLLLVSVTLARRSFATTADPHVVIARQQFIAPQIRRIWESRWGKVETERPLPTWSDYRYFEFRQYYIIVFSTHLDLLPTTCNDFSPPTTFS
jgi:hypothetical protein